jgi:hypothetical protein
MIKQPYPAGLRFQFRLFQFCWHTNWVIFACRYYGMRCASYFIPYRLLAGTFGAFIKIKCSFCISAPCLTSASGPLADFFVLPPSGSESACRFDTQGIFRGE